ncbi:MAG: serine/threonine protein kinase [Planctomycetales bacterium]|nr:serine/threonine protein kinase [Planctomycetales bacterium]
MAQQQAPTLKPNAREANPHSADQSAAARQPAGRFLYAGGTRPLAGYTIKRSVGQGGFGEIYFATSDAGKEVALKLIRRNLDVELRGIRQCLNLKHPNLLDIHDIRRDDRGDTWVVMEYVADRGLEDVLADHPNGLPPAEALAWIHGAAAGVAYLHQRGIVHRDLKPGNIFRDEGIVKIGDYGLSKFISCSRRSGQTESIGTVHYMAPEVANGRYGKEIDVYALGVILYELLTGRIPFEGESVGEVLMKHLTAKPDVSMLPRPFRDVVAKALEKDPELRFRSAAEMAAALPPLSYTNNSTNSRGLTAPGKVNVEPPVGLPPSPAVRRRHGRLGWHEKPVPAALVKSTRQRFTELAGSLLVGTLTAAVICVVAVLIEGYFISSVAPKAEQFAWLLLVGTAGICAVLVPAKFWEGFRGEPVLRRFLMMVLGMCVGAIAFGLSEALMAGLPPAAGYPDPPGYKLPPSFYDAVDGRPLLMAHVACFGTLFLVMRWWRQADPLRPTRISPWAVFLSVAVAGLVAHLWQFPQPKLPMIAGTISISVQLAAPWMRPANRPRFRW